MYDTSEIGDINETEVSLVGHAREHLKQCMPRDRDNRGGFVFVFVYCTQNRQIDHE